jgi:extradiol dioxygenase family protein
MRRSTLTPFHLAVEVDSISACRQFYGQLLGCPEGRSAERWVDFNLYGHQLVCHLSESRKTDLHATNPVDGDNVPVPHFGVVLELEEWRQLAERLKNNGIDFIIEPHIRFEGEVGEQATMFFLDPSDNALEFKAFADIDEELFRKD